MSEPKHLMKNIVRKIFQILFSNYFLLIAYIAIVSVVSYNHEAWRDEVDPWLLARDVDLPGLYRYTRNSGHPGLWHIILIPFAKLGFPNFTLSIVHLSFAISTAYLFLFRSTLKKYMVVLLLFGYYFLFEYVVVSRNYALSIFLLFTVAAIYEKRFINPILFGFILFLSANCNIYATIITSGIGLIYFIEIIEQKKYESKVLVGLSLIILGGVVCILQVLPSADRQTSPTNSGMFHMVNSMALPLSMAYSFLPGIVSKRIYWSFLVIPVGFFAFFHVKKIFIFFTWVILLLLFFYTFIFMNGHRHAGFLLITIVLALWIKPYYDTPRKEVIYDSLLDFCMSFIKQPEKLFNLILTISLIVSVRFSFQESLKDIRYSYSNAKEMSEFILENGYDNDKFIISTHKPDNGKTVLYFLKNKKSFYYPSLDSFGSHMWWDKKMSESAALKVEDMVTKTRSEFIGKENILFLSDTELGEDKDHYDLLYFTKKRIEFIKDENFFLYKLK